MHHHFIGIGTLALLVVAAPHAIGAFRDLTDVPPETVSTLAPRTDGTESAQAALASTIDATLAAGRRGDLGGSLDAFSASLQRHAHISDRAANAVLDAARSSQSREFLTTLASAVRHPEAVTTASTADLDARERAAILDVARSLRQSLATR